MVRATARQSEMGLRAALGASSGRLVHQLFAESALLATLGGLAGLAFAWLALPLVKAMAGAQIPRLDGAGLDGTALITCLASISAASFVCGLAPVVQIRARSLGHSIVSGRRGSSDPGSRLRALLVGAQVAAMVVLLAGAGLLLRSFAELAAVDPGFEPQGTLAVRLDMPDAAFTWEERGMLFPRIREAVTAVPGVIAVGATATDPFGGSNLANFVARADRMPDRAADFTPISWRVITPGFFEAMGMDILSGRGFTPSDSFDGLVPIVIGRSLARSIFGDVDAIDRVLVWNDPSGSRMRVVGVVEDLRDVHLDEDPYPIVYRAHSDIPWATMVIVARVQGDPGDLAQGIRARIQSAAPGLPVAEVRSLEDNLYRAMAEPRFNMQLMTSFAIIGLIMAVLGIYGLTAFEVRRRFREIGIRLSLGAEPDAIRTMIVRERLAQTAVAAGVGVVVAWALTRWIESQLYGVTAGDALTWGAVLAVVAATSTMAAYLPARKATHVHPRDVLNGE